MKYRLHSTNHSSVWEPFFWLGFQWAMPQFTVTSIKYESSWCNRNIYFKISQNRSSIVRPILNRNLAVYLLSLNFIENNQLFILNPWVSILFPCQKVFVANFNWSILNWVRFRGRQGGLKVIWKILRNLNLLMSGYADDWYKILCLNLVITCFSHLTHVRK